jgi:hypothetical protein
MVTLLWAVGLERITPKYIYARYATYMYARTSRCYNERDSRITNSIRSSIPHCNSPTNQSGIL